MSFTPTAPSSATPTAAGAASFAALETHAAPIQQAILSADLRAFQMRILSKHAQLIDVLKDIDASRAATHEPLMPRRDRLAEGLMQTSRGLGLPPTMDTKQVWQAWTGQRTREQLEQAQHRLDACLRAADRLTQLVSEAGSPMAPRRHGALAEYEAAVAQARSHVPAEELEACLFALDALDVGVLDGPLGHREQLGRLLGGRGMVALEAPGFDEPEHSADGSSPPPSPGPLRER
jgi:hypothetical protein